jgi:tetratricopeptide (TPR) repeat protein
MFGLDRRDTPNIFYILHRVNPAALNGQPVCIRLNEDHLCPCCIQVMVACNQVNEPQELEKLVEKIEQTWRPKGRMKIELKLEGDLPDFLKKGLLEKLLEYLEANGVTEPEINSIQSGCVKLTLNLPEDQAERLCWLADTGALDQFGLLDFNYVPLEHEVPATIPGVALGAYYGYLVHRAQFLVGDPSLPVKLDAEKLASETMRSAYGAAEKALSRDVTRAEQLPRLEEIQDRLLADSLGTLNTPPGEVHSAQQETDPYQAPTRAATSTESSKGEAPPVKGAGANSGIGQRPVQQTTDPPIAAYVTAGDDAPPILPPRYEPLMPPIGKGYRWPKKGGMGVVWPVRDPQFRRPLALKVMRRAERSDSYRERLFFAEARITAELAHPSIVPVHDMGRLPDGRPYYTMKLVKGKTLAEILQAEPDVASRRTELLQVFARVCEALAFAHRQGVIHRDLKPGNIMVGEHGEVQVIDWGVAKTLAGSDVLPEEAAQTSGSPDESNDRSRLRERLGTLPYMPPEQANGQIEKMGRHSDVFGLGAMLCTILTGEPPYAGSTYEDVMRQACEADLAGAYARLEGCGADAELIALARDCLSAKPNDRPPDASAVEERLTGYLASVQERLRQAELAKGEARARAEHEERTRRLAEEKAETERRAREQAEKARRRMLRLLAGLACTVLGLVAASVFAWRAYVAELEAERDREVEKRAREAEKRQSALDRALTAAMSGDLDVAEQATTEAEQAGASAGQVHMLRGQIALHRGESREARQHLEEAVRLLPDSVAAWGMLAAAHADDGDWERYDKAVREMKRLTPSTPEDFLFKGYAEAYLEPEQGLRTIEQAFDRRPMVGIALLLRAEVRAFVAQDNDDLKEAEGAVQDAKYARELLRNNPAAIWVSLEAHLAKAGVHEHRAELDQRRVELELAGKDADALKQFTALPEAVYYRWLYFREVGREEEVLEELRRASQETDHVYVTFCCALTLYRRGQRGDLEEALRVLERRSGTYTDRLKPFVLAELDYPNKQHDWPARALKAAEDYTKRTQDGAAVMDCQTVLYLLGRKDDAVKASKALLGQPERFYSLRREPILRCLRYNAGELSEDELVRSAGRSRWDQCLAHYSVAMTKLAEGDREGAKEHFDKAVKTRATGWGV